MATIAFIGLGKMGSGMAGRLAAAGHQLRVFNRTESRTVELVRAGAVACRTPAEACAGVSAVFAMTADDDSSQAVWSGETGVFAADLRPGTFAVECSTLSHDWVLELAGLAGARGLRYVDAPVTGLPAAAASGSLTLLVGAESADLGAVRPLLEPLSNRILHFGSVGAGTVYKLMINLVGAVQIASAAEGLALAERAGLPLRAVVEAIGLGQAASPQVVRNSERMAQGNHEHDVVFTPALRLKDVAYALRLARKLGQGTPFGDAALTLLERCCAEGHARANESVIFETVRTLDAPARQL